MKTSFRVLIGVCLIALLAALPVSVGAQDTGTEVTYNEPVEGRIDGQAVTQRWTLTSLADDYITVRVERLDGNLIPYALLLDSNDEQIARSYGADRTQAAAEITEYELPAAGTYTIVVGRDRDEEGQTSGAYRLMVMPAGLGEEHPNNTQVIGEASLDTPVTGEIMHEHWRHVYTLQAQTGDFVGLRADRLTSTLSPEVRLLDNNGQELVRGYTSSTGEFAETSIRDLPYTGDYQVVVLRQNMANGGTTGQYELTVSLLGSGEDSERLATAPPGIIEQYNTALQGEITNAYWYQDWQFRTVAGDTVSIIVQRSPEYSPETPNNLMPYLILLDSEGDELTRNYVYHTGDFALIDHYDIPAEGMYTVRVLRDGNKSGPSTGTYTLMVMLDGSGEGSPNLEGTAGEVQIGTPVEGELNNVRWTQTWTVTAEEGQPLAITVQRTSGTLAPRIEILDSNGISETSTYPENTGDVAIIERFRPPYSGEFQIVVFRLDGQEGYTMGGYSLTIEPSAE